MPQSLRRLPAVSRLLQEPALRAAAARHGHARVTAACRAELADLRRLLRAEEPDPSTLSRHLESLPARVCDRLEAAAAEAYPRVLNATGVLLHTNLGRAPLPRAADALASYLALEYDLATGRRGQRLAPLRTRLAHAVSAEAAVMVNNNAAALLLLLATHAFGREVIVSRGELIEIGGSFRLPELMAASGARLVEVGTTNRTHLADYERAIGPDTAAILVAHRSNFRIVGFTTAPGLDELAELAHRHHLPLLMDQGSGALHDLGRWGLPHEETVTELLAAGADAVCFSGDKLLGGPQAGIVVGARRWVEPLGRHPLFRALRPDKAALVWMDRVLEAHLAERLDEIPLYAMLGTPVAELRRRARLMVRRLGAAGVPARPLATAAALGGGTTPEATLPSFGLALAGGQALADALRAATPPVIGRLVDDEVVLDLRTVAPAADGELRSALQYAWSRLNERTQSGT